MGEDLGRADPRHGGAAHGAAASSSVSRGGGDQVLHSPALGLGAPHEALAVAGRPGQARGAVPLHARARAARAASPADDQRLEAVVGVAHDPALAHPAAPELELRLHQREQVEARRGAGDHRGQDLGQGDEREVHHDQVGPVRQGRGVQPPGVHPLHHGHAADPRAAASRALRSRRPRRSPGPPRAAAGSP